MATPAIVRLFPGRFLKEDACFQLFRQDESGILDLPITIEGESGMPFHVVHSDPDQLAFLAGLLLLQSWVYGIDELELPPTDRRPILIVTETPGRFSDAYLRLQIPASSIKLLSKRRGAALYQKLGIVKNIKDKSEFWSYYVKADETRTRLHNYFPGYQILGPENPPHLIASREHLGRGDDAGPSLLIVRSSQKLDLRAYQQRFGPFLTIFDAHGLAIASSSGNTPTLVYHRSIFAPELTRKDEPMVLCCLPDTRFERFCTDAKLEIVEPEEPANITEAWGDLDSALMALAEYVTEQRSEVSLEVYRVAARLRSILLSLPVSVRGYERALYASGTAEETCNAWSVKALLRSIENYRSIMNATGEWEGLMLEELIGGFQRLDLLMAEFSPKQSVVVSCVNEILRAGRRAALIATGDPFAESLRWALTLPPPVGLGLPSEKITVVTGDSISDLEEDQDCIVHHAFDPHDVFSALAKLAPRSVTFVLLKNELRFIGERFSRLRELVPQHPAHNTILSAIHRHVEQLPPTHSLGHSERQSSVFSDDHFELIMKLFKASNLGLDYGTVLFDTGLEVTSEASAMVQSCFLKLEGDSGVFLEVTSRVTCICPDNTVVAKQAISIQSGDRLIIISTEAREAIASRILGARRTEETDTLPDQLIKRWQRELAEGLERLKMSQRDLLRRIRQLGSRRITPSIIGQWISGDVLGPLDAQDLRRIGEVLSADWLIQNWQRVGFALTLIRGGHRTLGHRVTEFIHRAAMGSSDLSNNDEVFLEQLGITMAKLQDAVMVLEVEDVSKDSGMISIAQIGRIIPV